MASPSRPCHALLYARVSSKDQEREGYSIPAQQKLLRQYASDHRLTIVREFVDVETAKQVGRTGFREMLAFLRADARCQTVLVEKTDRLYRNIRDWVTVDEFTLTVHFVKENAVISKDSRSSEKFLHGIKVLMAKNYVDNLSEEVKKGLREKAEQGHWPSAGTGRVRQQPRNPPHRGRSGPRVADQGSLRGVRDRRVLPASAGRPSPVDRPHPSAIKTPDAQGRNPSHPAESDLRGRFSAGWTRCTRAPTSHSSPRELFEQVQSVLRRKPRTRYPNAEAHLHGPADLWPVRLCDNRGAEEGHVHLLPVHGVSGEVWQHLRARRAARRSAGRRGRADPDPHRRRRLDRRGPARRPGLQ